MLQALLKYILYEQEEAGDMRLSSDGFTMKAAQKQQLYNI